MIAPIYTGINLRLRSMVVWPTKSYSYKCKARAVFCGSSLFQEQGSTKDNKPGNATTTTPQEPHGPAHAFFKSASQHVLGEALRSIFLTRNTASKIHTDEILSREDSTRKVSPRRDPLDLLNSWREHILTSSGAAATGTDRPPGSEHPQATQSSP